MALKNGFGSIRERCLRFTDARFGLGRSGSRGPWASRWSSTPVEVAARLESPGVGASKALDPDSEPLQRFLRGA